MGMGGLCFIANIQFIVSLHKDIKIKEIWLHNSSNILTLIGAKVCFSVCWGNCNQYYLWHSNSVSSGAALYGELYQLIFFHLMIVILSFYTIILFTVTALVFYTIYLQLKRYIGMASIVVTGLLFFLSIYGFEKVASSVIYEKLLYLGGDSFSSIREVFPRYI